jgi:hypothetical protein
MLAQLTAVAHRSMTEIVSLIDASIVDPVLQFPGVWELLGVGTLADRELARALEARHAVGATR